MFQKDEINKKNPKVKFKTEKYEPIHFTHGKYTRHYRILCCPFEKFIN